MNKSDLIDKIAHDAKLTKVQAAVTVGAGVITCQDFLLTQGMFQLVIAIII